MTQTDETFSCPLCGQRFPWKPEYAGRKLACACGNLIEVQPPRQPETYDLLDDEPTSTPTAAPARRVEPIDEPLPGQLSLDSTGQEIPTAKPVRKPKVLGYRRLARAEQNTVSDEASTRRRDLWIPVAMIVLSFPLIGFVAFYLSHDSPYPAAQIAVFLGLRIVWDLAMTLIAGLVIHWFIDTGLGETPTAILKLIAIGILRFSISAAIAPDSNLLLASLGFLLTFPLLLFLFSYLFGFDFTEAMFCTVILSAMRLISYFGLWRIL